MLACPHANYCIHAPKVTGGGRYVHQPKILQNLRHAFPQVLKYMHDIYHIAVKFHISAIVKACSKNQTDEPRGVVVPHVGSECSLKQMTRLLFRVKAVVARQYHQLGPFVLLGIATCKKLVGLISGNGWHYLNCSNLIALIDSFSYACN